MITRRQIFERFTRADLLEIARHFDLKGLGGLSKGNIVTKLARKRSIDMEMVLSILYRSFLKSLCAELGLNSSGSKQVLIDRILGKENKREPKQNPRGKRPKASYLHYDNYVSKVFKIL